MGRRVAHHAVIGRALADLELGLDEGDDRGAGLAPERGRDRPEDESERDERHVDHRQLDRLAEGLGAQGPDVRPIVDDDARIAGDPVGELAPTDINGVDPGGAALQQNIAEPPGRRAGIEADEPGRVDPERVKGRHELVTTATHVWIGGDERDREVGIDQVAGLPVEPGGVADPRPDLGGEDQGLGSGAAVGEAAFDDELVEALTDRAGGGMTHRAIVAQPPSRRLTRPPTERPDP